MKEEEVHLVPVSLQGRAEACEEIAAQARAGADPGELLARLALIMAADLRDQMSL
ncbi:hypothetical protein [Sphingobium sp. WCS2017Hpa-17]|uniref:hypothetical protein n=1 Tax=Sphingobium sp. WCS2017Hpa-17 TaxID=3073638 RepID=UPI00288C1AB2|nr:hypothetical protein [Sphingobium sp. WCS2017Hpa-17]